MEHLPTQLVTRPSIHIPPPILKSHGLYTLYIEERRNPSYVSAPDCFAMCAGCSNLFAYSSMMFRSVLNGKSDEDEDEEEEKDSEASVKDCKIGVSGAEASLAEVEQQSVGIAVAKPSQATFASLGSSVKAINYSCEYKRFDRISESSESEDCDADLFEQPA